MLSFKAEFEPGMPTAAAPMTRQTIFLTMSPQAGTTYCSSRIGHTAVHVQLIGASGLTVTVISVPSPARDPRVMVDADRTQRAATNARGTLARCRFSGTETASSARRNCAIHHGVVGAMA